MIEIPCSCGHVLSWGRSPDNFEFLYLSYAAKERLQDLVDSQVERDGVIDEWPEHWEGSNAIDVWKCPICNRLYFSPMGPREQIAVYNLERVGIDQ